MFKNRFKILVPLITFLLCFALIEFSLSFFFKKNTEYFVWRPHLEYTFGLDDVTLRGVSKFAHSKYNSVGARSDELSEQTTFKIAAFGGSTTECAALDQSVSWTQLIQTSLNQESEKENFWVGNFGKSGHDSRHHILQTKKMLENEHLKDTRLVLYLVGFNDANRAMQNMDKYLNYDQEKLLRTSFMVVRDEDLPFHRRSATWKFLKHVKFKLKINRYDKEELAKLYKEVRKKRQEVTKTDVMPDLKEGLAQYRKNLDSLVRLCKSQNKTPVFISQPVLWRPDITKDSEEVLFTYFKENQNLETETLYTCMKQFNDVLEEVARGHEITYVDLFNSSKEEWFYDDCHFNIKGAQQVSAIILEELRPVLKQ